jgi:hypothetical protein
VNASGLREGPVAGSYEHGSNPSGSIKDCLAGLVIGAYTGNIPVTSVVFEMHKNVSQGSEYVAES